MNQQSKTNLEEARARNMVVIRDEFLEAQRSDDPFALESFHERYSEKEKEQLREYIVKIRDLKKASLENNKRNDERFDKWNKNRMALSAQNVIERRRINKQTEDAIAADRELANQSYGERFA